MAVGERAADAQPHRADRTRHPTSPGARPGRHRVRRPHHPVQRTRRATTHGDPRPTGAPQPSGPDPPRHPTRTRPPPATRGRSERRTQMVRCADRRRGREAPRCATHPQRGAPNDVPREYKAGRTAHAATHMESARTDRNQLTLRMEFACNARSPKACHYDHWVPVSVYVETVRPRKLAAVRREV